jgi:hypothetical protein
MTLSTTSPGDERELSDEQWYDLAEKYASKDWNGDQYFALIQAVGKDAIALSSSTVQQVGAEWISVKDRLPSEHQTVAVVLEHGAIVTAWATYWHGASNAFNDWVFPHPDDDGCVVTHWMALPSSPKSDGGKGS